jgi:hypothetical protein
LDTGNYITATASIARHVVYKNGTPLFIANKETNLPAFLLSAYHHFELLYPKFYKMDNLSKLGMLASEVLLEPANKLLEYAAEDIGVVLANASSSLDTDMRYFETVSNIASPSLFVYTLPNIVIGEIFIRNKFKGENAFFVFKQFDSEFIKQYVDSLLDTGTLKACICGWLETLDDDCYAVLYLVEKKATKANDLEFTIENINKTYQLENG